MKAALAELAKQADAPDPNPGGNIRIGSNPIFRTKVNKKFTNYRYQLIDKFGEVCYNKSIINDFIR